MTGCAVFQVRWLAFSSSLPTIHIVMCRKIFSPILYQQIRGRGTRTAPRIGKKQFVIYDFFRNHQYFNDDGAEITSTAGGGGGGRKPPPPVDSREKDTGGF